MKIGVIADTHIPVSAEKLPDKVYEVFKDCDMIIHAGDLVEMFVISDLEKMAEIKAVYGNMDSAEVREKLPEKLLIEAAGKKIGVFHGRGPGFKAKQLAKEAFKENVDIIIFAHSHTPFNEEENGILYFNPGSPTDAVFAPYKSFGMIEISGDDIRAQIIKLED